MATNHEPIPGPDQDFDTLQKLIVEKVTTNAVAWDIPAGVVTDLTTAQAPWTSAWAVAQFKTNVTTAQRETKDLARKNYEKVLRPFIQKWIFRNSSMTDDDVLECGLKPHDTTRTPATKPLMAVGITAEIGIPLQIITECPKTDGAKYYGCIMIEGGPIPEWVFIDSDGIILLGPNSANPPGPDPNPHPVNIRFHLSEQRKKVFSNLVHDATYFIYFYLVNTAGVSPLSEAKIIKCW